MNESIGFRIRTEEKQKLTDLANERNCSISELARIATLDLLKSYKTSIYSKEKLSEALICLNNLISCENGKKRLDELNRIAEVLRCLI